MIDLYDIHPQMLADAQTAVENLQKAGINVRDAYIAPSHGPIPNEMCFYVYAPQFDHNRLDALDKVLHCIEQPLRRRTRVLDPMMNEQPKWDRYDLLARPAK